MSYILDALSKSQRERQRQGVPTLATQYSLGPVPRRGAKPWPMMGLGAVLAALIIAAYALMRLAPSLDTPRHGALAEASASSPAPAETTELAASVAPPPASRRMPLPAVDKPMADDRGTHAAKKTTKALVQTAVAEPGERPAGASTAVPNPLPESSAPSSLAAREVSPETLRLRQELLALEREAGSPDRTSRPAHAATTAEGSPGATEPASGALVAAPEPDHAEAIAKADRAAATGSTGATAEDPPMLGTLPTEVRTALLPLTVNAHAYAQNPDRRMIIVNMRRYREGARMREGPVVETITPDGAVLVYEHRRFKLPAR